MRRILGSFSIRQLTRSLKFNQLNFEKGDEESGARTENESLGPS